MGKKQTLIIYIEKHRFSLYYSSPSVKSASVLTVGERNVPEDVLKGERESQAVSLQVASIRYGFHLDKAHLQR